MLLSQTGKYALRAAIYLAERGGDEPVTVSEIAARLEVPRNYLSKILHQLSRDGVLVSERGPHGGFQLAARPSELSLARVLASLDPVVGRTCLLGRSECSDTDSCPLHDRWKSLANDIEALLQATTLGELVAVPRKNETGGRP